MRAYIDESTHVEPPGLYVLAAVVVPVRDEDRTRDVLLRNVRPGQKRFHWREEDSQTRDRMATAVGGLDLATVMAVSTPIDHRRSERARRACLTQLLWELEQRDVGHVLFESRHDRNRHDRAHILAMQKARHLAQPLRYDFGGPLQEPLLWLPDLVAGAVNFARGGREEHCLAALGPGVVIVDVGAST